MLTYIFGAGASFDSLPQRPSGVPAPPLAMQLFDNRSYHVGAMTRHPAIQGLVPPLRAASEKGGGAFEETLRLLQEEAQINPDMRRSIMAVRWYLRDILVTPVFAWWEAGGGVTNYAALLAGLALRLHKERMQLNLITFNYDQLIEYAITSVFGHDLRRFSDYRTHGMVRLFMPHGSVRWWQYARLSDGAEYQTGVPHSNADWTTRNARYLTPIQHFRHEDEPSREGVWVPAIAIPVDRTKTFACPDDHLEAMRHALSNTSELCIIGWRATEEHFLKELSDHLPDQLTSVTVVDTSERGCQAIWNQVVRAKQGLRVNEVHMEHSPRAFTAYALKVAHRGT